MHVSSANIKDVFESSVNLCGPTVQGRLGSHPAVKLGSSIGSERRTLSRSVALLLKQLLYAVCFEMLTTLQSPSIELPEIYYAVCETIESRAEELQNNIGNLLGSVRPLQIYGHTFPER
eukprot:6195696-Pleurochrysis_carterae.AAC.3